MNIGDVIVFEKGKLTTIASILVLKKNSLAVRQIRKNIDRDSVMIVCCIFDDNSDPMLSNVYAVCSDGSIGWFWHDSLKFVVC